jgi:OPA family glycerol-3-phosphate transporter-like MFS transporter
MPPTAEVLRPDQRRLVVLAWIAYAAYYLGRVNIATALPAMQNELGLSAAQVGLFGTLFFWVYAVGQLVNGRLGDHFSPRRFVLMGLLLLWAVNGWLQAVGWGPTLRLLANWLTPGQRARIATPFGTSFVAGNAFTWLLTGWVVGWFGWRAGFVIPAALMGVVGLLFWLLASDAPAGAAVQAAALPASRESPFAPAAVRRAGPALLAALATGFCYAALLLWTPTYFVEVAGLTIGRASTLAAIMPVVGIGGTLLAGWVNIRLGRGREGMLTAVVLLLCAGLFLGAAAAGEQLALAATALILASGAANAATSLVLSAWPLVLGSSRTTSSLAGLLGFAFNIGGGFSGSATGMLLDRQGWTAVFAVLALMALAGAAAAVWLQRSTHDSTQE